jgi:hypothetical protein
MKIGIVGEVGNEIKRCKRRQAGNEIKCSIRRRGIEISAFSYSANPNELNDALPLLKWAKFKKHLDTFYPNNETRRD